MDVNQLSTRLQRRLVPTFRHLFHRWLAVDRITIPQHIEPELFQEQRNDYQDIMTHINDVMRAYGGLSLHAEEAIVSMLHFAVSRLEADLFDAAAAMVFVFSIEFMGGRPIAEHDLLTIANFHLDDLAERENCLDGIYALADQYIENVRRALVPASTYQFAIVLMGAFQGMIFTGRMSALVNIQVQHSVEELLFLQFPPFILAFAAILNALEEHEPENAELIVYELFLGVGLQSADWADVLQARARLSIALED